MLVLKSKGGVHNCQNYNGHGAVSINFRALYQLSPLVQILLMKHLYVLFSVSSVAMHLCSNW